LQSDAERKANLHSPTTKELDHGGLPPRAREAATGFFCLS
jgi:hypothetical protein